MSSSVAIIDYGMGNLKSVSNALTVLGQGHGIVSEPEQLGSFDKVIIPGVGAFSEAMSNLRRTGLDQALMEHVQGGRPLFGICLGMQLLCTESTEDGCWRGFGWIPARVIRFPQSRDLKVPHMGWNSVHFVRPSALHSGIGDGADFYFVHSYYVDCVEATDVVGQTEHGVQFASVIQRDNVCGAQFHPEKSQQPGLVLLRNFVEK